MTREWPMNPDLLVRLSLGYGSVVGVTEMRDEKSPCEGAGEDRWTRVLLENKVVLENVIGS